MRSVHSAKLTTGSIVELKSGGPQMTVVSYSQYGVCKTVWFDGNGNLREFEFDRIALLYLIDKNGCKRLIR